jgi:purine-binding chemotaxis protein CheW
MKAPFGAPTDEQERRILKDRATVLSRALDTPPDENETIRALRFSLGAESYAVAAGHIREVIPLPRVTPLPCVPSFVRGIVNVRGRIVSLLDLRVILGLPDSAPSPNPGVIILQSSGIEFGLLADEIQGLAAIPLSSLQTTLPTLTGVSAEYLKGITAEGIVLLDGEKLLSDQKLVIDEAVGGTA